MTDPLVDTLGRLADPDPADVTPDPGALATAALRRARRRTRTRRAVAVTTVPLVAAAAVLAVSVLPGGLVAGLRGDGPAASPTTGADAPPWGRAERVTVLLVGSDAGPDREGWRADSVVVASVDTRTGDTLLVGVPRNRLGTTGPDGRFVISPDPRTAPIQPQVERLTGLSVDTTLRVDMAAFARVVDTFGGVEVTVRQRLPMGGSYSDTTGAVAERPKEWLLPGRQRLDGRHALWFARSRFSTDDYDRMRRQRCLLGALAEQVDGPRLLAAAPTLLADLRGHVDTTIRLSDLPAWVGLVEKVRAGRVRGLTLDLPVQADGAPDVAASRAAVAAALAGQAAAQTTGPAVTPPDATATARPAAAVTPDAHGSAQDLTAVC